MSNILVIGGAGFIGTALCKALLTNPENRVYVLDNYFTGSKENHIDHPNIFYTEGDADEVFFYFGDGDFEYVFHFGEYSRVEQSYDDRSLVFELNLQLHAVLEFCLETKAKLIYSGSSTKFSNEGASLSPYAWTKAINTDLIKQYGEWFGLDYAIVYFYNVYGPGEINSGSYATLIGKFTELNKRGEPLTVTLPGTQVRNFTHIDDTVAGILTVANHGKGDGYGIGADKSYSVEEVARAFSDDIEYILPKRGNRMSAGLVTDKTKALGWEPKNDLMDYIKTLTTGTFHD